MTKRYANQEARRYISRDLPGPMQPLEYYFGKNFTSETLKIKEYMDQYNDLYKSLKWIDYKNMGQQISILKSTSRAMMDGLQKRLRIELGELDVRASDKQVEAVYEKYIKLYKNQLEDLKEFEESVMSELCSQYKKKKGEEEHEEEEEERDEDFNEEYEEGYGTGGKRKRSMGETKQQKQPKRPRTQCKICGAYSKFIDQKLEIPFCNIICQKKYYAFYKF
jgi:hypothetical protein